MSYNATTFHDRDRRLQGVFASARDMTELKAIEQALQQKNAELEDASRMKSEFLANMSHELRTPLNAIIGFSEVLGDGLLGDMTDKQRRFIGDIFKSGKHLLSLINDILDLSKVEAGKMLLDLEPGGDRAAAQEQPVDREGPGGGAPRAGSTCSWPTTWARMTADARKVKQIVYNLLSNAVKFTADGGDVILRADRVPRGDVGVAHAAPGRDGPFRSPTSDFSEFLRVSVTDNGIGMSPEGLEHLFKPFSQVDSGLARQFEGTGLGLAMVKLLADLHGGVGRGRERRRRGLVLHRLDSDARGHAGRRAASPQSAGREPDARRRRARARRSWSRATTGPRSSSGCSSRRRASR